MRTFPLFVWLALVMFSTACSQHARPEHPTLQAGGIIRTARNVKEIHLVFTGHEFADGGKVIRAVLRKHHAKASFFFTGDFYRTPAFSDLIASLKKDGHYLGGHSDKHLLYCTWEKRDSLLVSRDSFMNDLRSNYRAMNRFRIRTASARFFLPPYEWYNDSISAWTSSMGLVLVNFTPGTYSNADWTHPELGAQYLSSDSLFTRILRYEARDPNGLNGFLLLTHIGTDPRRTDKFYNRLDDLLTVLGKKGYRFTLLHFPFQ